MNCDPHRLSDEAILTSIVETLRTQIVPAVQDPWARASAIQLAALAELLRDRPPDPSSARADELAALLSTLGEPTEAWSYDAVLGACSSALGRWSEDDDRRHALRQVLVRHLDEDLASNLVLLSAFRGHLPDA